MLEATRRSGSQQVVRLKSARLSVSPKPRAEAGAKDVVHSTTASPRTSPRLSHRQIKVVAPAAAPQPQQAWQAGLRRAGPGLEMTRRSETPQRFAPGPGLETIRRSETPQRFAPGPGLETIRRCETPQTFAPCPGLETTRRSETPQRFALGPGLKAARGSETPQRFAVGPGKTPRTQRASMCATPLRQETIMTPSPLKRPAGIVGSVASYKEIPRGAQQIRSPRAYSPRGPGSTSLLDQFSQKGPQQSLQQLSQGGPGSASLFDQYSQKVHHQPLQQQHQGGPGAASLLDQFCEKRLQQTQEVSARDTLIEQLLLQVQSQQLQLQQLQKQQQQASCSYTGSTCSNSTLESDAPRGSAATCSSDEEKPTWRSMAAAMKKRSLDDKEIEVLSKFEHLAEENEALLTDKFEARVRLDEKVNERELDNLLKPSMKVRELRASEKALAMQQRYIDAEKVKSEANSLEKEEFARKTAQFFEGPAAWRAFATQQEHKETWKKLQRDLCVDFEKLIHEGHLPGQWVFVPSA